MYRPTATPHATATSCERCGAAVLRQKTGLPWVVTADIERLTPAEAALRVTPNQRAWCLRESRWSGTRLVEAHHRQCEYVHVVEHACPPGTPAVKGALW